jgi:polyisoprenoid-binding protein YceI
VGLARFKVVSQLAASLRCVLSFFVLAILLTAAAIPANAQQLSVTLDPVTTQINFTLAATLHTVHGAFKLKSGQLQWDTSTGHATGSIVIDATSGNTDNASRDKNMHAQVLESAKFPEITFAPSEIKGTLNKAGQSQLTAAGIIRVHGQDHETTLNLSVQPAANGTLQATAQFPIPYVKWGMKDPSTFLLHVGDTVNLEIQATATIK